MEKSNEKSKYVYIAIIVVLVIINIALLLDRGNNKSEDRITITSKDELSTDIISKKESENINDTKEITLEDKVTIDKYCEFSITRSIISKTINPKNPDSYYHYLNSDDGKILVGLELEIKSLKNEAVLQNSIIKGKIIYDNNYEYICTISTENPDGKDIETYTNLYNIEPLETLKYFVISEVPEEVSKSGKSIKIIITVNGNEYSYNIK